MISYIIPPVAVAAFVAAPIAGVSAMKVEFQAMRIGIAIYFLPFFFVLEPALILNGTPIKILQTFFTAAIGLGIIGGAMEGYILKLGRISWWARPIFFFIGLLIAFPVSRNDLVGLLLALLTVAIYLWVEKRGIVGQLNRGKLKAGQN